MLPFFLFCTVYVPCVCVCLLQEESSVKSEEQSLRSRFGPSTEDLTNTSKQVWTPPRDMWYGLWASAAVSEDDQCSQCNLSITATCPPGCHQCLPQSSSTETSSQEIPHRDPEPGGHSPACHDVSCPRQACSKVSQTFDVLYLTESEFS